eukprot:scaffold511442_cov22-Prasinocladus_malaysianus.AAC.1
MNSITARLPHFTLIPATPAILLTHIIELRLVLVVTSGVLVLVRVRTSMATGDLALVLVFAYS